MRILIADDNDIVRRGVIGLLSDESDWTVCGEAKDGSEAIQKARELLPDVILHSSGYQHAGHKRVGRRPSFTAGTAEGEAPGNQPA